jgi:hypothetical protein
MSMNTNKPEKMRTDEAGFLAALVVVLLVILPCLPLGKYGGGIAMLAAGVIGLVVYLVVFGERLRNRGRLKSFVAFVAAGFTAGAAIAFAFFLMRRH